MSSQPGAHATVLAVLVQPPPGDLTGPYPALPYLKARAQQYGHEVRVVDTAIDALWFFAEPQRLQEFLAQACSLREHLETRPFLSPGEQGQYGLLSSLAGLDSAPELLADPLKYFTDRRVFYDYRAYKRSRKALDALFKLLSALHFPTILSPSEYPTAQELNSFDAVMAHGDPSFNPYVDYYHQVLLPLIQEIQPRVLGISLEFASQSVQALALGRLFKERFPETHITMGGAYLSQWVLQMGPTQLHHLFTCTDSVVCGEGEDAFAELLNCMEADEGPERIPNLLYKDRASGGIRQFDHLEYPDVTTLPPPDFSDLDLGSYLIPSPVIPYAISRGCYWGKCTFCQNRYGENRMRRYQTVPVEKALAELTELSGRYGTNHFNFSNDVLDPPYLKRFSEAVISSGQRFVWNTDLRAESSITRDLCRTAARAGLNSVAIGFESACQRTLDAMNKGKRVEDVRRVMKDLYDHGVAVQAMGILGYPGETEEEAELTVRFLEENTDRISYYVVGLLMVVPGSRMHETPHAYGVTSISYEGNALMAPLPVWRSDARISTAAVKALYHRLGHLEEVFAINEYPYVGALSTNHGFLYFRKGPDILKRLRSEEYTLPLKLNKALGAANARDRRKKLKALAHRITVNAALYESPFPLERIPLGRNTPQELLHRLAGPPAPYLVSPAGGAIHLGLPEVRLISRMTAQGSRTAILEELQGQDQERLSGFLLHLAMLDLLGDAK